MPNTIDFTNSMWGHAFHGDVMYPKSNSGIIERIMDRVKDRRRYTVLVHSEDLPMQGDMMIYNSIAGKTNARITKVTHFNNPNDMFKLEFTIEDKDNPDYRSHS